MQAMSVNTNQARKQVMNRFDFISLPIGCQKHAGCPVTWRLKGRVEGDASGSRPEQDDARIPPEPSVILVHEVSAAVLLPARFVRLGAERSFLAEADHLNSARGYSTLD